MRNPMPVGVSSELFQQRFARTRCGYSADFVAVIWCNGNEAERNLRRLGIPPQEAKKIAGSRHGPWHLALTTQLHVALDVAYWRKQGLVFLEDLMGKAS